MRQLLAVILLSVVVLLPASTWATADHFLVTSLTPDLIMLSTNQGTYSTNSLVFFGEDGVLLVDTQSEGDREALRAFVDSLGLGAAKYIINTHRHIEHIGGNDLFGPDPVIIAHRLFPEKLLRGTYVFSEYPPETYPDITFADSLELRFNGETIRMVDIAGSHDDNEIMVHFRDHKVAHVSSVVNGFNLPSVDKDGNVLEFEPQVRRLMELLPEDVRLVSGHNGHATGFDFVGTWGQLGPYADMLHSTVETVRQGLAEGKDVEKLQDEGVLDGFEDYAGSYVGTDDWIKYVAKALTDTAGPRKDICGPVFDAWKSGGTDAAVSLYRELATGDPEEYDATENTLLNIGFKLFGRGLYEDAAAFLKGSAELYPDAEYGFYTHYVLGKCYQQLGRLDEALEHARESTRLNPDFVGASAFVSELTGEPSD